MISAVDIYLRFHCCCHNSRTAQNIRTYRNLKYHKASVGLHSTETGSHWHIQSEDTFKGKNRAGHLMTNHFRSIHISTNFLFFKVVSLCYSCDKRMNPSIV